MRKKKIYLDTSTVSYLRQEDAPTQMAETLEFWDILKMGRYDVFISTATLNELTKCAEPKRSELLELLSEISYTLIEAEGNDEIIALAGEIQKLNILPAKSLFDRLHIASAVFAGCNAIISWNFRHMVNVKTIDGVRVVCVMNNLPPVDIYSPTMLLERSDNYG